MLPSINLDSLTISEVNYQYELESVTKSLRRIKQCYLLLGTVKNTAETDTVTIKGCIKVPFEAEDTVVNMELLKKRHDLIKVVSPDNSTPVGLMVLFANYFDYSSIVNKLVNNLLPSTFQESLYRPYLIFHYEPSLYKYNDKGTIQETGEEDLHLHCYIADQPTVQDYSRVSFTIKDDSPNIVIREGLTTGSKNSKLSVTGGEPSVDDQSEHLPLESVISLRKTAQNKVKRKLNGRINQMLKFLKNNNQFTIDVGRDVGERRDMILRRISMLVSHLEKGPTRDIELELARTENELKVLEIACEQWEISNRQLQKNWKQETNK